MGALNSGKTRMCLQKRLLQARCLTHPQLIPNPKFVRERKVFFNLIASSLLLLLLVCCLLLPLPQSLLPITIFSLLLLLKPLAGRRSVIFLSFSALILPLKKCGKRPIMSMQSVAQLPLLGLPFLSEGENILCIITGQGHFFLVKARV